MKKIYEMLFVVMLVVILTGCSKQNSDLVKETVGEKGEFNKSTYDIAYSLTEEQQENFASAGYYILCSVKGVGYMDESEDSRIDDIYIFVYGGRNVELDENGVLHGYYGKEALYGYNQTEKSYSRIPLIVTEDAKPNESEIRYTCSALISNFETAKHMGRWEAKSVHMKILVNDEYPDGIVKELISTDDDKTYKLDEYDLIEIATYARYLTYDENGEMKDYFEWDKTEQMLGLSMNLTEGYHLEMKPIEDIENYYCMFFIKDNNGNISYSELIPIKE